MGQAAPRAKQKIPPATRRAVLQRDEHRCRVPGCKNTSFLDLHHIVPRSEGGRTTPDRATRALMFAEAAEAHVHVRRGTQRREQQRPSCRRPGARSPSEKPVRGPNALVPEHCDVHDCIQRCYHAIFVLCIAAQSAFDDAQLVRERSARDTRLRASGAQMGFSTMR